MDVEKSIGERVQWIKDILIRTGAKGIIYGNSGGKDCTLVGALCKMASDNVLGVIMPCESKVNYGSDRDDALEAAGCFGIRQAEVDLTAVKAALIKALGAGLSEDAACERAVESALININPRLRMTVLYAMGQARGYLVAGTGNACELTMGYFTKWGDGACDFNPVSDLTVDEVYEMLRFMDAPARIVGKAPSAGLYDGQTDEAEMGLAYRDIGAYLRGGEVSPEALAKIEDARRRSAHKLRMPLMYGRDKI